MRIMNKIYNYFYNTPIIKLCITNFIVGILISLPIFISTLMLMGLVAIKNNTLYGLIILIGSILVIFISNLILSKFNNEKSKKGSPYKSMIGTFISLTVGIIIALEIICLFIKIE